MRKYQAGRTLTQTGLVNMTKIAQSQQTTSWQPFTSIGDIILKSGSIRTSVSFGFIAAKSSRDSAMLTPHGVRAQSPSHVWLFAIAWTVTHWDPLFHRISQARILEWVAISFSRGWIFLTQGSNPHLLYWQVDSLPLTHQGSPNPTWIQI